MPSNIYRGAVVTTPYGQGIVTNLPVFNRIAVRYPDGTVRYFFLEDVTNGTIKGV